jgi:hypothetical protein
MDQENKVVFFIYRFPCLCILLHPILFKGKDVVVRGIRESDYLINNWISTVP